MICGIDIGGTFTRIGCVDDSLNVHGFTRVQTPTVVDDFSGFIKAHIAAYPSVRKIVIGFPGVVNPKTQEIIKIPNQKSLERLDIKALEKRFNLPIEIYKDTVLLFHYDQHVAQLKGYPNVLGFYLGTGLGNIIYLNHQIHYGDTFAAAELGHQGIKGNQSPCPCGLEGCFETVCSGHYLKYLHQTYFASIPFDALFSEYGQSSHRERIETFIDDFAFIIASQMHILDVKRIIIGGGVVQMTDFPKASLTQKINQAIRHEALKPAVVYWSQETPEQGVIGAAIAGFKKEHSHDVFHRV